MRSTLVPVALMALAHSLHGTYGCGRFDQRDSPGRQHHGTAANPDFAIIMQWTSGHAGATLGSGHSGNLGKYSTGLVLCAIGGKMSGGFNILSAKAHLSKTWGLGPQHADAVLLIATTMEAVKRLGSEAEGKAWLDAAAQVYAQCVGISLYWQWWQF